MRKKLKQILSLFLILGLMLTVSCGSAGQDEVKIGVGGEKGMYYKYAKRLAEQDLQGVSLKIKTTAGSAAGIRLLQKGFLDAAIVQSDALYGADQGEGVFSDEAIGKDRAYSAACGLYTEAVQIVVRKDSDILNIEDLEGKAVSVGEKESGVVIDAEQILLGFGISFDRIKVNYMSFEEAAEALRNKEIDAFFCTAGAPTQAVEDLTADTEIRILSLKDEDIRRIRKLHPAYLECRIAPGTYKNQEQEIKTLGVRAVLVVSNKLDKETVRKLTETVYNKSEILNQVISGSEALSPESAVESIVIPFHPGAAEFLKEQGAEVTVDKNNNDSDLTFGSQDR